MIDLSTMPISYCHRERRPFASWLIALLALGCCVPATPLLAQAPAPAEPAKVAAPPLELASLAWLDGCWRGEVAQYEFREHWLPLRGGLMVGAGHVVFQGKTQDYGYLRLETRPDGVYYVAISSGKKEDLFKLTAATIDDKDTVFTFTNPVDEYPQRILYRRGLEGWLYATVEGKVKGEDRKVIYPMRRVDCQSGELIRK
jgi:Domain of unknown function (DUF6265)